MSNKKEIKNLKWYLVKSVYTVLFFSVVIFAYYKTHNIFTGTKLTVKIEQENSGMIKIVGKAPNAIYLSLNGREIFIDKDGNFTENIASLPGLYNISLTSKDKFGNTKDKNFEVFYEDKSELALLDNN